MFLVPAIVLKWFAQITLKYNAIYWDESTQIKLAFDIKKIIFHISVKDVGI